MSHRDLDTSTWERPRQALPLFNSPSFNERSAHFDGCRPFVDFAQHELPQIFRGTTVWRTTEAATAFNLSCTAGVCKVASVAALSLRMIGSGVPLGIKKPY